MTSGGGSAPARWRLAGVDRVEVLCLVDNVIDGLLASTDVVEARAAFAERTGRPTLRRSWRPARAAKTLRAEHGFSALITIFRRGRCGSILLDAGMTVDTLAHNMSVLSLDVGIIDGVVLSHGHFDHTGGLNGLPAGLRKGLPLIVHPDAWLRASTRHPKLGAHTDTEPRASRLS